MNILRAGLLIAGLLMASSAYAERQIAEIFQPTSLLGTDTEDEPLKNGQAMAATILRRPVLIGGAFPESPVDAMCLPHRIAGAGDGFPVESNLIVLIGAKVQAEWGEKFHTVTADFSQARASEDFGGHTFSGDAAHRGVSEKKSAQRDDDTDPDPMEAAQRAGGSR
jgi:hypothetical protein